MDAEADEVEYEGQEGGFSFDYMVQKVDIRLAF